MQIKLMKTRCGGLKGLFSMQQVQKVPVEELVRVFTCFKTRVLFSGCGVYLLPHMYMRFKD